jgi:5-methylcytosine-specific restriction endonuclease McrA
MFVTAKEAQAAGDIFYFSGSTCKYGHISKRYTRSGECVECALAYHKKRQQEKKEQIATRKRLQRQMNRAERAEWRRKYRQNEPAKLAHRDSEMRRRAIKRESSKIEITREHIDIIWKLQKGRCAYCRQKLKEGGQSGYHVDHIVPLAKGGYHLKKNLQLTCAECNVRKSKKDPIDFAQSLGLML